jgi:hypothetical protein
MFLNPKIEPLFFYGLKIYVQVFTFVYFGITMWQHTTKMWISIFFYISKLEI